MNEHRFFNQHQPPSLQSAVILCYIDAVLGLLGLGGPGLILVIGLGAGAFGIANEKKWGYAVAVASAVLQLVLLVAIVGLSGLTQFDILLTFVFDVLLVGLLLHPMSRDYQRIWFK